MQAQTQTIFSQLVEDINRLLRAEDYCNISDLVFQRLKNSARKLVDIDPGQGYSIKGMLACLKEDIDEMHRCHLLSLRYGEYDYLYSNYSASLENSFFFDDAYVYALKAYELAPGSEINLNRVIELADILEKEEDFQKYAAAYKKLTGNEVHMQQFIEDDPETLKRMLNGFNETIESYPELLVKPDEKLNALVDELVDGVELD